MLRVAILTILGVFVLLFAGTGQSPQSLLEGLNRALSGRDFSTAFHEIIPFDSVIVSAGDFVSDPVESSCVVVVVGLSATAPTTPPKQTRSQDGRFVIGGRWRETPERMKLAAAPDLLETCGHLIDHNILPYLTTALDKPGNFVIRDWRDGVLQIYAPTEGIAAYLSFGPNPYDRRAPTLPRLP